MNIQRKLVKPMFWLLTITLLFGAMPISTFANDSRYVPNINESSRSVSLNIADATYNLVNDHNRSIDLSSAPFEPRRFRESSFSKDNEESTYIQSVAEALTEPIGLVGYESIGDEEEMHVFIWLQELPDSLERIYKAKRMNVQGYSEAQSNARNAREQIRNRGRSRAGMKPSITITFEYSEVFAGFAIKAPKSAVEQLAEMPGVYMVTEVDYYELPYKPDPTYATPGNVEARRIWRIGDIHSAGIDGGNIQKTGEAGRPVRVGVIDSGIQADHPDINGASKGGWNFTNCSITGNSNNMTLPSTDHGIHVAGTIASGGIESSLGIAPGVDLYMAQVFGVAETTTNSGAGDIVIAAIESFVAGESYQYTQGAQTYQPGLPTVDIINMSIGVPLTSPYQEEIRNTAYEVGQYARNNAVVAGVVVVAAAGNDAGYQSFSHQGERNPYTITTGGASLPISVAASMYGGSPGDYKYDARVSNNEATGEITLFVENGDRILSGVFKDGGFGSNLNYILDKGYELHLCMSGPPLSNETVTTTDMLEKIEDNSLDGKILVVGRGISFSEYRYHTLRTGAGSLIIINHSPSFIGNMSIGSETSAKELAILSAPVDAAQTLLDLALDKKTVYLDPGKRISEQYPKEPAGFSSIGPVRETAEIKPDVIAPGYAILSTSLDSDYSQKSGTSMAAPNVAGVAALMLQRYPNASPAEIKARMMNTADPFLINPSSTNNNVYRNTPHYFNPNGDQISVYEQGAGFIDPYRAIMEDTNVFVTVENNVPTNHPDKSTQIACMASFSFGDAKQGSETKRLTATVHEASDFAVDVIYRNNTRYSVSSENMIIVNTENTGANTFDVWLTISKDTHYDPKVGNLYEGYIKVTANGKQYHLPWAVRVEGHEEPSKPPFNILAFATRPIVSTSADPMVRSAGGDHPRNSNATTLYYTWSGTLPIHPYFGVPAFDLCLYTQNKDTGHWEPAYYLGSFGVQSPLNDGTRLHHISNRISSQGMDYYTFEQTTIKNGAYIIVIEAGSNYEPYGFMDIGIVFTDGVGDMSVQLTIDGLDNDDYLLIDSDKSVTTVTISGRIFSPALHLAARQGFLWTDVYDFWWNSHAALANQSFNILAFSSIDDIYGVFKDSYNWTGVIPNGDDFFYCDADGYFELTLNIPKTDKNDGYLFSDIDNHSIVGLEGFYYNDNGTSWPLIGANKSLSIAPRYRHRATKVDCEDNGCLFVRSVTATCWRGGWNTNVCSSCGATEMDANGQSVTYGWSGAVGHDYETIKTTVATCWRGGWEYVKCNLCDYETITNWHNALSHKFGQPQHTNNPLWDIVYCEREGCDYYTYVAITSITSLRIDALSITTVARYMTYSFSLILNEGATSDKVIWEIVDPSLGYVDNAGNVTIFDKTGNVRLTATDPVSGLSHSIMIRIAS